MNKNVINISLLLSTSVFTPDMLSLVSPYDRYSDNLIEYGKEMIQLEDTLTEVSLIQEKSKLWDGISPSEMVSNAMIETITSENEIIESVVKRIQACKSLPTEFSKIIDDNFWDLI